MKKYHLLHIQNVSLVDTMFMAAVGADFSTNNDLVLTPEQIKGAEKNLAYVEQNLTYLSLRQSLKYLSTVREELQKGEIKYGDYEKLGKILQGRIDHELEDIVFGFIPTDRAPYFQQKELFGAAVNSAFPSAVVDITEAGNCFAQGSYTASVFHLMRVLEKALHKLTNGLGVSFPAAIELENWQNIIEKIESAIRDREKQLPKGTQKSEEMQHYSEAAKEFRYFKDAWRNHVSHSRMDYDVHDATKIMEHVKDFMKHLAAKG